MLMYSQEVPSPKVPAPKQKPLQAACRAVLHYQSHMSTAGHRIARGQRAHGAKAQAGQAALFDHGSPSLLNEAPVFLALHDACVDLGELEQARSALARGVPPEGLLEQVMTEEWHMDVALGRPGTPQEVGELFAFLLSARAAYLTGAVINIDGGTEF